MKNILVLLLFLLSLKAINAQSCDGYFPAAKGTIMETTSYNEKGKKQTVCTITIQNIEPKADGVSYNVHAEITDEKNKPVSKADYEAACSGSDFSISMKSMITAEQQKAWEGMDVKIDADDITYPTSANVGDKLKDAHLKIEISMSGMNLPGTTIDVVDRVVAGKESLTTPAGTFDCIKVTSTQKIKNIVNFEMKSVEWLSKGNGVIKTESYKGDKMKGYSELTKITK